MAKKKLSRDDIVETAFALFAEQGWSATSLTDIADACDITLSELSREFGLKSQILTALIDIADRQVLAETDPDDLEESHRDRLFDILMRRFDALLPYKTGLERVVRELPQDPLTAIAVACRVRRSMAWMLAASGIDSDGLRGGLRTKGLGAVWALAMRDWFSDDSPDMSKTMASLDKLLSRAESLELSMRRSARPAA